MSLGARSCCSVGQVQALPAEARCAMAITAAAANTRRGPFLLYVDSLYCEEQQLFLAKRVVNVGSPVARVGTPRLQPRSAPKSKTDVAQRQRAERDASIKSRTDSSILADRLTQAHRRAGASRCLDHQRARPSQVDETGAARSSWAGRHPRPINDARTAWSSGVCGSSSSTSSSRWLTMRRGWRHR